MYRIHGLGYDRHVTLGPYGRARVREAWIVDLERDAIESHRHASRERYTTFERVGPGGTVSPALCPDIVLTVDDALPAR